MFALDRSLNAIETTEQNVVAICHSSHAVNAACPGLGRIKCEAYVCAVLEGNVNRVYVAFIDAVDRTVYVYSDGNVYSGNDSSQEILKDALGFAESLGFTMDTVNLSYGKALREVVIRGIRAISLLPVGKKTTLPPNLPVKPAVHHPVGGGDREKNPPAEQFPVEEMPVPVEYEVIAPVVEPVAAIIPPLQVVIEEEIPLVREPESVEAEIPLVREPVPVEEEMPLVREPVPVEEEMPLVRESEPVEAIFADEFPAGHGKPENSEIPIDGMSCDNLEVSLQQALTAENLAEGNVAEAMFVLETASAARLERERVLAEKNAAEQILAAQVDAARLAWERTETVRVDCERLLVDTVKAERSAKELFEEARLALEAASAERCEREKQLEDRAAAEIVAAKNIDRVRLEWENTEAERVEWENLLFQSRENEKQAEEKAASTLKELEEAIVVRSKQERLLKSEQAAREAREASLSKDLSRGAGNDNDGDQPEQVLAGAVLTGEVTDEVALLESSATPESTSPGFSGAQSAAEGVAAAESFTGEPAETARLALAQDVPAPFVEPVASPFSSSFASSRPPFVSSYGGSPFASEEEESDSQFAIDPSLQTIELGKDDQVTDYFQSLNVVRLKIENLPSQSSSSYLCAVNRNGMYSVYFALFLSDSNRTIVYCPRQQPLTAEDKEKVIMEGVSFAETVGFMMDRIEPDSREKQAEQFRSSPVFTLL